MWSSLDSSLWCSLYFRVNSLNTSLPIISRWARVKWSLLSSAGMFPIWPWPTPAMVFPLPASWWEPLWHWMAGTSTPQPRPPLSLPASFPLTTPSSLLLPPGENILSVLLQVICPLIKETIWILILSWYSNGTWALNGLTHWNHLPGIEKFPSS